MPAQEGVAQRDQHGLQLPSLVVVKPREQCILGLALGARGVVEVPPASGSQGHDMAAAIRRVSLARDETAGFKRVEQRHEDAGIDAHDLPKLTLSRRPVIVQQPKKVVLARLEIVGFEGPAQAALAQLGTALTVRLSNVYADDDTQAAVDALAPLLEIGPLLGQQTSLVPYAAIVPPLDNDHYGGRRRPLISNGFANRLTPELSEQLALGLRTRVASWISIRSSGGAVNDLDAADTAYAHRHQNFNVSSVGRGSAASEFVRHWDELRPHLDGLYTSFETDERPERLHDAFPGDTLAKLRQLKARYDPDNVFNRNFPIPPTPRGEPYAAVLSADRQRKESE